MSSYFDNLSKLLRSAQNAEVILVFYDVFNSLCSAKGISCKRASMEIGLSNSTAAKWKRTGATPNGDTLSKIADYFGVTTDYLLNGEPKEKPSTVSGEEHSYTDLQLLAAIKRADEKDLKAIRVILGIE